MKTMRSSRCSLKFLNKNKRQVLEEVLQEYGRVVNGFIDLFWENTPKKTELLKPIVDSVNTWMTFRLRKVAAREAIDMVLSAKNREDDKPPVKPRHAGKRMCVSSTIAELQLSKTKEFDAWIHLASIGKGIILDVPIRFHKHFNRLSSRGVRLNSYIITNKNVQFSFEVETGPKLPKDHCVGIDTGINALASVSTEQQFGKDIKKCIDRIKRCKHGSKGQKRAVRALRQRMDEVAKEITGFSSLVVVENLKNITKKTKVKRRLNKSMRRSIGRWNVRYWLNRLEMTCQDRNVSFRTVSPAYTSQMCSACGHVDRGNRNGEVFKCLKCGHEANADVQASKNILARFLTGPYGAGCKPLVLV